MVLARARAGVPFHSFFTAGVLSVLGDVSADHISEMSYHDCFDTSVHAVGANNAIFITLKPGVAFQPGIGTFADDR